MRFSKAFIPYGGYWSTPFAKWQGSLSNSHAVQLAAQAGRSFLDARDIEASAFDAVTLGVTVPQHHLLYGAPWFSAMLGNDNMTGTMIAQACATGARSLATSAAEVELTDSHTVLNVTADRCSNGPHIYYPNPSGPGGTGKKEDWVMDGFGFDPWAKNAMLQTAENVAAEAGITREEQDACTLIRHSQYQDALADDGAFQKRYMLTPFEVKDARGRKTLAVVNTDEGVFPTNAEGLAKLRTVMPEGTVTFGSQTHPADGNCGMIVCDEAKAKALSTDGSIRVQLLSYAEAKTKKGFMAMATVPAANAACEEAGTSLDQVKAIKTHNPFAVNDIYFSRETGIAIEDFNRYGSSLIFGHPQGPTGTRLIMELIEELAIAGGGIGCFVGCAAGDSAAAVVLRVGD